VWGVGFIGSRVYKFMVLGFRGAGRTAERMACEVCALRATKRS
jgi:hypothetical protein